MDVTFKVRDLRVTLPAGVAEVIDEKKSDRAVAASATPAPPKATPKADSEITNRAKAEAAKRYPALAIKDSMENTIFVTTVQDFRTNPNVADFFEDPQWPLVLADMLAERNGWKRSDVPQPDAPAPAPAKTPGERTDDKLPPAPPDIP